ncbi:MAG: hypothetical protein O7B25_07935 [Gammaproteobacteria bacterium]|nr:hypothetical protein [Gammaproteobacteria bacterium]
MKSSNRWLLIGSLAVLATHAIAADAPVTSEKQTEPESAESTNAPIEVKPAPEIFVPSEDISEDFAVSFPVDI